MRWAAGPRHRIVPANFGKIRAGMTEQDVEAILGAPAGNYSDHPHHGIGVPQSWPAAVDYYLLAAEHGDPTGQYLLGLMYYKGFGVSRDVVLAYKWLNIATAQATPVERDYWARIRDAVGTKLSLIQRTAGQDLASEWFHARRPPGIH